MSVNLEGGDGQDQLTNNMIYLMLFSSLHLTFRVYHSSSEVSRLENAQFKMNTVKIEWLEVPGYKVWL